MGRTFQTSRLLMAALALSGLAGTMTTVPAVADSHEAASETAAARTTRLAGTNRYETSAAISAHAFPEGSAVVHISRSDLQVDALSGGSLTTGPILLVPTHGSVPQVILNEVDRLGATQVIALGGPGAVSEQVLGEVARGRSTGRLSGTNRYETASAISRSAHPAGAGRVFLASTDAEALALRNAGGPVLPIPASQREIPQAIRDELARLAPTDIWLPTVNFDLRELLHDLPELRHLAFSVGFFDALDARSLSAQAARLGHSEVEVPVLYLARVDDLADAMSGSVLKDGPVLLVARCGDTAASEAAVELFDPARLIALGGPNAVCDETLTLLGARARDPYPSPSSAAFTTLPDHGSVYETPVAWSDDGRILLVSHGTLPNAEDGLGYVVDTATGVETTVPWSNGWEMHHEYAYRSDLGYSLSPDGTKVWAGATGRWQSANEGRDGILELSPADGSMRLAAEGFPELLHASTAVLVRYVPNASDPNRSDTHLDVHNLETGEVWTMSPDDNPYELDAWGTGPIVRAVSPTGQWLAISPPESIDPDAVFARVDLVFPDGSSEPLVVPEPLPDCQIVHFTMHAVSHDLRRVVWSEYQQSVDGSGGDCGHDGTPYTSRMFVLDRPSGVTREVVDPIVGASPSQAWMSGDGSTLVFWMPAPWDTSLPDNDSRLLVSQDGPRFVDGPAVDGERHAMFLLDLDRRLQDGTVVATTLPFSNGLANFDGPPVVGQTGATIAWRVSQASVSDRSSRPRVAHLLP